jgi:hypothetical protein
MKYLYIKYKSVKYMVGSIVLDFQFESSSTENPEPGKF